jgi:hypothetical protein
LCPESTNQADDADQQPEDQRRKKKNDMSPICHHHTKTSVVQREFVNFMFLAIPCVVAVHRPGWSQNEGKNSAAKGRQQLDQPPIHKKPTEE